MIMILKNDFENIILIFKSSNYGDFSRHCVQYRIKMVVLFFFQVEILCSFAARKILSYSYLEVASDNM